MSALFRLVICCGCVYVYVSFVVMGCITIAHLEHTQEKEEVDAGLVRSDATVNIDEAKSTPKETKHTSEEVKSPPDLPTSEKAPDPQTSEKVPDHQTPENVPKSKGRRCISYLGIELCSQDCNPKYNTNGKHPRCYGGSGYCHSLWSKEPAIGICYPNPPKIVGFLEACGDSVEQQKLVYTKCGDKMRCVSIGGVSPARCMYACTAPQCKKDWICDSQGICRPKRKLIRTFGEKCRSWDPTTDEFHLCSGRLACMVPRSNSGDVGTRTRNVGICVRRYGDNCQKNETHEYGGYYRDDDEQPHYTEVCKPNAEKTRKQGESCLMPELNKPSYHNCAEGLICEKNVCIPNYPLRKEGQSCDTKIVSREYTLCESHLICQNKVCQRICKRLKPKPGEPPARTCNQYDACVVSWSSKDIFFCMKSRRTCDPEKGLFPHPNCKSNEYCTKYCTPLPSPTKSGPKFALESCAYLYRGTIEDCNTNIGLTCHHNVCRKACKPTAKNECPKGEECVKNMRSHTGGVCVLRGTQALGESCAIHKNRCRAGLACVYGNCANICNPFKATPVTNTDCPNGSYCMQGGADVDADGYCRKLPSPPKPGGTLQEFRGRCSRNASNEFSRCDVSKKLACVNQICQRVCNPRLKTPGCKKDETCIEDTNSYLGGLCSL